MWTTSCCESARGHGRFRAIRDGAPYPDRREEWRMGKYIVRRLLQMIPVIIGATFPISPVVFPLPGAPVQGRCGERPCPPSYVAAFRAEYNLDKPVVVQYLLYM